MLVLDHALAYAKANRKKILWIVAKDWPLDGANVHDSEELEKRRFEWLQKHDRETGGIMGLFPCILGMPMRITDTQDRKKGAFKHSHCTLLTLGLPADEIVRIEACDENEIVSNEQQREGYFWCHLGASLSHLGAILDSRKAVLDP